MEDPAASVNVALAHGLQLLDTAPALAAQQAHEILASAPGHPAGVLLLGLAASAQRQFAQAVEILRPLVQAQAGSAAAWLALADAQFGLGDDDAADAAYMQHVRLSVRTEELMQAADALAQGHLPRPKSACVHAYSASPPTWPRSACWPNWRRGWAAMTRPSPC